MDTYPVVHTRLSAQTRDCLRAHAHTLGRSLNQETRVWLEVGAAMFAYAWVIDPGVDHGSLDTEELEERRAEALHATRDAIARALPHYIGPEVAIHAFTPVPSPN
jgi:hypothetical protein